jgi:hypothetical protein
LVAVAVAVVAAAMRDIAVAPVEEAPRGLAERLAAAAALRDRGITAETAFIRVVKMEPVVAAVIPRRVKTAMLMGLAMAVTEGMVGTTAQYLAPLTG